MIYNGTDLSDYDLKARLVSPASFMPSINNSYIEVADKAYDFQAFLKPRIIELECYVTGTSESDLIDNLDNISLLLSPLEGVNPLVLDFPDDRYYNAKVNSPIDWNIVHHKLAQATITFICPDPRGYDNDNTSSDHNINSDPDTVEEAVGGTAYVDPVYTLTAGEALNAVTIKVENTDTEEELQWTGSLANGEVLVINTALFYVTKEGSASMSTVTGQFPRLKPGQTNHIKVTAFSTTGTLNITYRETYL
jgi:predicted phage tail component-like protein